MKRSLIAVLLASTLGLALPASAADLSAPSEASGALSGLVVIGSILTVGVTGSLVVESVQKVGEGVELLVTNASDASKATVRLSGQAARGLSLAAGTVLDVVVTSSGKLLVLSGKVIAFIPNELGKALLHHSQVS